MIHADDLPQFQLPNTMLPAWVMDRTVPETLETAGFGSGAALSTLHLTINNPFYGVPAELLRNHLALASAQKCLKLQGRGDTISEIRDAYCLTAPGDDMGPAGHMYRNWRTVAGIRFQSEFWVDTFIECAPTQMRPFLAELFADPPETMISGNPMTQAIAWAQRSLHEFPRCEEIALQTADIALCRAVRVPFVVPLFALHIRRKDIRALEDRDRTVFAIGMHRALGHGAQDATRMAHDLQRRAMRLREIAPKLRAKGSEEAVELFLTEYAVTPSTMLSPYFKGTRTPMTPRAARRLCDRLVEFGVVKELTGRSTFRLYGVTP